MQCLEESIQSVIKLYLPSTKPPVLHVFCTECSDNNPHIMLKQVSKISLNLPNLYCSKTGKHLTLTRTSYLPFGHELDDEQLLGKCIQCCVMIHLSLGTLVPNIRDRQGKLWLLKKQKTALKTTLQ